MESDPTIDTPSPDVHDLFAQEQKEDAHELFLFEIDNELYAVSVEDVDQVMKIPPVTSVPNAPDSILGIFHLRGKVIVAIDLLRRMHIKRQSSFVPLYLFVSHKQKNYFAVLVDRVFSVIKVPKSMITPLSPVIASKISAEYVRGMFMYKEPIKTQKRPDNFMIEPKKEGEVVSVEEPPRPALWLNIPLLLDQQEILKTEGVPD